MLGYAILSSVLLSSMAYSRFGNKYRAITVWTTPPYSVFFALQSWRQSPMSVYAQPACLNPAVLDSSLVRFFRLFVLLRPAI